MFFLENRVNGLSHQLGAGGVGVDLVRKHRGLAGQRLIQIDYRQALVLATLRMTGMTPLLTVFSLMPQRVWYTGTGRHK